MPGGGFVGGKGVGAFFQRQQLPEDLPVHAEKFFKDRNSLAKLPRQGLPVQPRDFRQPQEQRRHAPHQIPPVRPVPRAGRIRVHRAQTQIAHRLLAKKFFQRRVNDHVRQRVRAAQHAVIALDAGKFRSEGLHTARKPLASQHKGIRPGIRPDGSRYRLMRRGVRAFQHDEQIQIGNACKKIPPHRAAVQTAGMEIVAEFPAQGPHRLPDGIAHGFGCRSHPAI